MTEIAIATRETARRMREYRVYDLAFVQGVQEVCANGWVARDGFSVRSLTRAQAMREAISATVVQLLMYPMYIWQSDAEVIMIRDAFIEINRAVPAYSKRTKVATCIMMSHVLPLIMREYYRANAHVARESSRLFDFVLHASMLNWSWSLEECKYCNTDRHSVVTPLVVMYPCAHVLCATSVCQSDQGVCAQCAHDDAGAGEGACAIYIDSTLRVPDEIIDRCVELFARANIENL